MAKNSKKPLWKRVWFWILVVVVIIAIAGSGSNSSSNSANQGSTDQTTSQNQQNSNDNNKKEETKKEEPKTKTRDNSSAKETVLSTGSHVVGTDIPEGRYVCTSDSTGNFFVKEKDIPVVNEILDPTAGFGTVSVTIDLKKDQVVDIQGIKNVTFTPAETSLKTNLTTGDWIVGLDIEPGRYLCETTSGSGNFFVYRNGLPKVNEILDPTGNFGVPNVTAELKDGDRIQIVSLGEVNFTKK